MNNITLTEGSQQLLPSEAYTSIAVLLTVVPTVGFLENLAVIVVFFKNRHLMTPSNLYITGMAICDFVHCTIGMPMVTISAHARKWIFARQGCVYYGFITTFLGITQITILTIIAVHRYKTLLLRHVSIYKSGLSRYIISLVACYCHGLVWATFPLAGWSSFQTDKAHISCCINWKSKDPLDMSYVLCLALFCFVIPVLCIGYSCCGIYLLVRRKARNKIFRDKNRCTGSKQFSFKVEKDIAITVFLMIGCFLLSWTPYALVSIISALGKPNSISTLGTTLPAIFAKCSTLWNPVIYVIRNGEFRRSLFATLSGMPCNRKFANTSMHPCSNNSSHDAPVKSSNRGFLAMTELKSENSEHHTVFFTCIAEPAEVPSVRTTSISEDVQVETDDVTEEMRVELVTTAVQTSNSLQFISATVT